MLKSTSSYLLIIYLISSLACAQEEPPLASERIVKDVYFGEEIEDPYQYMEQLDDPEVMDWMKAQANYTRAMLDRISGREALVQQMQELDQRKSAVITNVSITENDRYFYLKRKPDDETGKLFFRQGYEGEETLLFDPTTYAEDEKRDYVISGFTPNKDGSKLAFFVAPNGSERNVLHVMDVERKKLLDEKIDRIVASFVSWLPDDASFFYHKVNSNDVHDKNRFVSTKMFVHQLGNDPKLDVEVLSNATHPELGIQPEEFPFVMYDPYSQKLFALASTTGTQVKFFIASLPSNIQEKIQFESLFTLEDKIVDMQADDSYIYACSNKDAPNFKMIRVPLKDPSLKNAETVVPESKDAVFASEFGDGYQVTKDYVYYRLIRNGVEAEVYSFDKAKKIHKKLELPTKAGSVNLESKGANFEDVWITINGWTSDYQRYKYVAESNSFELEPMSSQAAYPEFENLIVKEVLVNSHDGAQVPLSIIHPKGLDFNGQNPALVFGYGAYGISINPSFRSNLLIWAQKGGVVAFAHVRGGGELGDQWHLDGQKENKPNTWKDLIACVEYLHTEDYTSSMKTAIMGASAGGILVGRAMTERPDLFAVALPLVGVMNPLRVEYMPAGPANFVEFGNPSVESEYKALVEMDAYSHIREDVKYPASLITAGMNDPRVPAWQPAKFAARLQSANASEHPILFYVDFEAGHGIGNTRSKDIEEAADIMSFALWQMNHPNFKLEKEKGN